MHDIDCDWGINPALDRVKALIREIKRQEAYCSFFALLVINKTLLKIFLNILGMESLTSLKWKICLN